MMDQEFTADFVRGIQKDQEAYKHLISKDFINKMKDEIKQTAYAGFGNSVDYELDFYNDKFDLDYVTKFFKERGFKVHIEYGNPIDGVDVLVIEW